jgi:hypothetical protein
MRVTNKINSLEANSTNNQVTTPSMRKQRRQLIVMLSVLSSSLFIAILLQVAARPKLTGAQANPSDHATGTGINDTSSTSEPVGSSSDQVVPGSTATTSQTSSVTTSSSDATVNVTNNKQSGSTGQAQSTTTVNVNGQNVPIDSNGTVHKTVHTDGNNSSSLNVSITSQSSPTNAGDGM